MKNSLGFRWLPLAALVLLTCPAMSRPLLVPADTLELPPLPGTPAGFEPGYGSIAIDEGTLLVVSGRPTDMQGGRESGVYIFERNTAGRWAYAGILTNQWTGDLRLDGSVATIRSPSGEGTRVFERGAAGWTETGVLSTNISFSVIRIEDGSIYTQLLGAEPPACNPPYQEWRKVNGAWTVVATIGAERCERTGLDVNDGSALIVHWNGDPTSPQRPAEVFASGRPAWVLTGTVPQPVPGGFPNDLGVSGTIRGDTAYFDRNYIYRNSGGAWTPTGRLVEPERELDVLSRTGRLRGNHLFLMGYERDYQLPEFDGIDEHWQTVRAYRQTAPGRFTYHARLTADASLIGYAVSDDGRQLAAVGWGRTLTGYSEQSRLYVFEMPDTSSFPGTRQETFSAGNYASWTPTGGSFSVVTSGASRVLRQSSLAGESGAYLTAYDWTDQSIEADMRPRAVDGADRWFGLVTRRADAQNYYYVTFRFPNVVSIRRMRNGVFTELARTTALSNFQIGRNYRVRLESVGDQHAVFVDGFPLVRAMDDTLAQGNPGLVAYRTRFDADNVTVSGGTRVLLRLDSGRRDWSQGWQNATGTWELTGQVPNRYLRQTDAQADARWFSTVPVGYQVVSARVRPQQFGAGSDPWIGLAAHVTDDSNYYYITLRRSNQLSLRRLVNGQVQVLGTVAQPLTVGSWHDLRLEIVGTQLRAYVNGDLKIERTIPSGSNGRHGLLMWKMAADVESFIAYQP